MSAPTLMVHRTHTLAFNGLSQPSIMQQVLIAYPFRDVTLASH